MVKLILKIKQRIASAYFKLETLKRIKHSVKITIQVLGLSLITFVLLAFFIAIFGESLGSMLVCKNPFTSGFVHFEIEHLFYNLLLIFLFTFPKQNTHYDIQKLFWITFIISFIYLPICLLGLTHYSIGISGTCYFLITRYAFSNSGSSIKQILSFSLFGLTLLGEYIRMKNTTNDDVAHGIHFIGVFLGVISLYFHDKLPKISQKIF